MRESQADPVRVLVADDDDAIRRLLTTMLTDWGYEVVAVSDGRQAWDIMRRDDAPMVAILDWMMPGMTGTEVIAKVRAVPRPRPPHLLLLTARDAQADIVEGLRAGANDYLTKPFDYDELQARLESGTQVVGLQAELERRVRELEEALEHVKRIEGLVPICSYCKKIRDDQNYWQSVESYLSSNAEVYFSHGICPDCYENFAKPQIKAIDRLKGGRSGS
jgi:CheY-like chemotaxis protein